MVNDLADVERQAEIIIANRKTTNLADVELKVYTRDLFGNNCSPTSTEFIPWNMKTIYAPSTANVPRPADGR